MRLLLVINLLNVRKKTDDSRDLQQQKTQISFKGNALGIASSYIYLANKAFKSTLPIHSDCNKSPNMLMYCFVSVVQLVAFVF